MKMSKFCAFLILFLFILSGCVDVVEKEVSNKSGGDVTLIKDKELILQPEDRIEFRNVDGYYNSYYFNGFINKETISFSLLEMYDTVAVYQPARVGHTFEFKNIKGYKFIILEVNYEENYIRLKSENNSNSKTKVQE